MLCLGGSADWNIVPYVKRLWVGSQVEVRTESNQFMFLSVLLRLLPTTLKSLNILGWGFKTKKKPHTDAFAILKKKKMMYTGPNQVAQLVSVFLRAKVRVRPWSGTYKNPTVNVK